MEFALKIIYKTFLIFSKFVQVQLNYSRLYVFLLKLLIYFFSGLITYNLIKIRLKNIKNPNNADLSFLHCIDNLNIATLIKDFIIILNKNIFYFQRPYIKFRMIYKVSIKVHFVYWSMIVVKLIGNFNRCFRELMSLNYLILLLTVENINCYVIIWFPYVWFQF